MIVRISLFLIVTSFVACQTGQTDQERMEEEVRHYYFLEDSAKVEVEIVDTLNLPLVYEMLDNVDQNLFLIQQDIDTLNTMIDELAYDDSLDNSDQVQLLQYSLHAEKLSAKKDSYIQTRRILNHLQRAAWADIAGFNAVVTFHQNGERVEDEVLLDGDLEIID